MKFREIIRKVLIRSLLVEWGATPSDYPFSGRDNLPVECEAESWIPVIGIRLSQMRLERPRQWGACWLACELWQQLGLDRFWGERPPAGRQGTRWAAVLRVLGVYRLVAPVVNGICIATGLSTVRWETFWERTSLWLTPIPEDAQ